MRISTVCVFLLNYSTFHANISKHHQAMYEECEGDVAVVRNIVNGAMQHLVDPRK